MSDNRSLGLGVTIQSTCPSLTFYMTTSSTSSALLAAMYFSFTPIASPPRKERRGGLLDPASLQ